MTSRLGLVLLLAGLTGLLARSAVGQGDEKPASGKTGRVETEATKSSGQAAATEFVARVHAELRKHPSVKADIEHTVSIGSQQFRATGRYLNSGSKLRLEYVVKPDQGADGSLIEVCDGKELWSLMTLGGTKRVTHRDVQQIKAAAASSKNVPDAVLTAELGLGGLSALFASLERTMTFDAMKQDEVEGRSRTIVQGQWKNNVISRWKRKPDDPLPAFVPDMVRIIVDSGTLFPERIVYLKKQTEKDKKGYRALVSFQFKNVELDAAIDEQEFTFVPPEDVVPEDVTRQFLDRITKSQESDAAPATSAAPTTKAKPATGTSK
ncbi:MAG: hypothetical protein H7062_00535 [Candidatus Saccharimonas sp.]|nr:hypothetical protein [Planctomycetaceae bacterium]